MTDVTLKLKVWGQRPASILLSPVDDTYSGAEWLPLQPLTVRPCLHRGWRGFAMVTMPDHIAKARGFV